jgi:hypothetical protein
MKLKYESEEAEWQAVYAARRAAFAEATATHPELAADITLTPMPSKAETDYAIDKYRARAGLPQLYRG